MTVGICLYSNAWLSVGITSRQEKKGKVVFECRIFKEQWSVDYFVIEPNNKTFVFNAAPIKYNIRRYCQIKNSWYSSQFTRKLVHTIWNLKLGLSLQPSYFIKEKTENKSATTVHCRGKWKQNHVSVTKQRQGFRVVFLGCRWANRYVQRFALAVSHSRSHCYILKWL